MLGTINIIATIILGIGFVVLLIHHTALTTKLDRFYCDMVNHLCIGIGWVKSKYTDEKISKLTLEKTQERILEYQYLCERILKRKPYYHYLLSHIYNNIEVLKEDMDKDIWGEKQENKVKEIIEICNKLIWSFVGINTYAEGHKDAGYYYELDKSYSKTHKIINKELKKYWEEKYQVNPTEFIEQ